ncbi:hypothetical protein AGLY_000943 [Aphis glycines]|uniref:Uncharacterized protein n=1 Tax=Aphis glycines TaxID=307491 RepID=A0A6G0U9G5_APHGL|nr:hypothetical protein AGLY_000943 [Aphis glycines]
MDKAPIGEPREVAISQKVGGGRVGGNTLNGSALIRFCDQGIASVEPECVPYGPHDRPPVFTHHNRTPVCDRWGASQRPADTKSLGGVPRPRPHTTDSRAPRRPENAFILPGQVRRDLLDRRVLLYPPSGDLLHMVGRVRCNSLVRGSDQLKGAVHCGDVGVLREQPDTTASSLGRPINILARRLLW